MIKSVGEYKLWNEQGFDKNWVSSRYNKDQKIFEGDEFTTSTQVNFGDLLKESISKVNDMQIQANTAIEQLATGQSQNLHETLLLSEQADIAFKTMNQLRSKVIDIYREMMKIQL